MQQCTPVGYVLRGIAEWIGFAGLLTLLIGLGLMVTEGIAGKFNSSMLWIVPYSFAIGLVSELLYQYAWSLAHRKSFQFHYERRETTWIESGETRSYRYPT